MPGSLLVLLVATSCWRLADSQGIEDPAVCALDQNGNAQIDVHDVLQAMTQFGRTTCGSSADFNSDCDVSVGDILQMLAHYGNHCGTASSSVTCGPGQTVGPDGSCQCPAGYSGPNCRSRCSTTAAHLSLLLELESTLPCAECMSSCYRVGLAPDWTDAGSTCNFLDTVFTIDAAGVVDHHSCNQCTGDVALHGIELYLACHGGTAVVGGSEDTPASISARAALVETIDGLCFEKGEELGQAWHGIENCNDIHPACPAWQLRGECTSNPFYMRAQCRLSCSVCELLDPADHMCITDPMVLDAVGTVPRHMFTPRTLDQWPGGAYRDWSQQVGFGATISTPHVQALMTQLLQLSGMGDSAKVLEIGTGSGYQTALLVAMGWDVHSIEIVPQLHVRASGWLTDTGYMQTGRLHLRQGDGYLGWPDAGPFDGIMATCSPSHVPQPLKDQLKIGGKLLIPVGPDLALSRMLLITRTSLTTWEQDFMVGRPTALRLRLLPRATTHCRLHHETIAVCRSQFTCRWVPLQGGCVLRGAERGGTGQGQDECASVGTVDDMPVCPSQRFAQEWAAHPTWNGRNFNTHANDYYHAVVVCENDPCGSMQPDCADGHVANPTCCVEVANNVPCTAVFRDDEGTVVTCDGSVTPCAVDSDCPMGDWCRATEQVATARHGAGIVRRQCTAYQPRDAACGGLTMPWFFQKCAPPLVCVTAPGQPDLPGTCGDSQSAVCPADYYYSACRTDLECRSGYSCGAHLDGCVPPSCDCHGSCAAGCAPNSGICEERNCDPAAAVDPACLRDCPPIWNQVCGENGRTYNNECFAECACVEITSDGPCNEGGRRALLRGQPN